MENTETVPQPDTRIIHTIAARIPYHQKIPTFYSKPPSLSTAGYHHLPPRGDKMTDTRMEDYYRMGDDLASEITQLKNFGHISTDGEFSFNRCTQCDGPTLGHKQQEAACKRKKYSEKEKQEIEENLKGNAKFDINLAEMDVKYKSTKCEECNEKFSNRAKKEKHKKEKHKPTQAESCLGIWARTFIKNMTTGTKNNKNKKTANIQLMKVKKPPRWIGQKYEIYATEIEAWNEACKDEEYNKYAVLLESLKKTPSIKPNLIELILERTKKLMTKQ
jgi:hypothetical protein